MWASVVERGLSGYGFPKWRHAKVQKSSNYLDAAVATGAAQRTMGLARSLGGRRGLVLRRLLIVTDRSPTGVVDLLRTAACVSRRHTPHHPFPSKKFPIIAFTRGDGA